LDRSLGASIDASLRLIVENDMTAAVAFAVLEMDGFEAR